MKSFPAWQPLHNEDAHTASCSDYVPRTGRQAFTEWLSATLGGPAAPKPLEHENFWPSYDSVIEGSHWTEPEMVFETDDGEPLVVIVEAKPGLGMHSFEQIS